MPLSIGIIGLPNVGKSTLFNALTKKDAEASNYPFCTIDPNIGIVKVPDERLGEIAAVSRPKKIVPATIKFIDIAGLVKGAHRGEGLGNRFLHHIRECDAVCEVVRNFLDDNITHTTGKINPENDREIVALELMMADLETVEKRLTKAEKEAKGNSQEAIKLINLLKKLKILLAGGRPARELATDDEEKKRLKNLNLLSAKPIIYVLNSRLSPVKPGTFNWDGEILSLNIKQEEEIAALKEDERKEFIRELGLRDSGLNKLIKASYKLLGLITFFTTGSDETRAWTVKQGTKAPRAAGVIHTDFARGFIRVEAVEWKTLVAAGGEQTARKKGLIRAEGKNYTIQDGDVCNFLFNKT